MFQQWNTLRMQLAQQLHVAKAAYGHRNMQWVQKIVKEKFSVTTLQIIFIFSDLMHIESIFSCLYAGDKGDVTPTPYSQSHLDKLTYVNTFPLSYCQKLHKLLQPITFFFFEPNIFDLTSARGCQ